MSDDNYVALERLLAEKYEIGEWALIFELSKGVGWVGTEGRIDAAAFNCWPSKGHHRLAFEVKRTRGDFIRELKTPAKRKWVEENFHMTYFVTPYGLVKTEEVPEKWGLICATKKGDKLRQVKQATHRDVGKLPESLALSAIRACAQQVLQAHNRTFRLGGEEVTPKDVERLVQDRTEREREMLNKTLEKARQHETSLMQERTALQDPFRILENQAGRYGWRVDPTVPMNITGLEVKEMLERKHAEIRREIAKQLLHQLRDAHGAIGFLLKGIPLDDLLPSERHWRPIDPNPD